MLLSDPRCPLIPSFWARLHSELTSGTYVLQGALALRSGAASLVGVGAAATAPWAGTVQGSSSLSCPQDPQLCPHLAWGLGNRQPATARALFGRLRREGLPGAAFQGLCTRRHKSNFQHKPVLQADICSMRPFPHWVRPPSPCSSPSRPPLHSPEAK